ncbi:hypothetical protein ACWKWU_05035 [Chitinophaga lutea]
MAIFSRKLLLSTQLPADEVRRRLNEHISAFDTLKRFDGHVRGESFRISKVRSHSRNSFAAQVKGTVEPGFGQTQIRITMKPNLLVVLFLCLWMGMALMGAFTFMTAPEMEGPFPLFRYTPFIMLSFGAALFIGGFQYSANECQRLLQDLLDAEKVR